jgi:importin subunit alpha-1
MQNYLYIFTKYENEGTGEIIEMLFWSLGNIVGENILARDSLIKSKVFEKVFVLLNNKNCPGDITKVLLFFIANSLKTRPAMNADVFKKCINSLLNLILNTENNEEFISDCLWGINYASEADFMWVPELLLKSGICEYVLSNDKLKRPNLIMPSVRLFGNLLSGESEITDDLINLGCISFLQNFLIHKNFEIRQTTLWALSNITAGNLKQIQAIIDTPELIATVNSLTRDNYRSVVREALWLLGNIVNGGNLNVCLKLIEMNIFVSINYILENNTEKFEILILTLRMLMKLLLQGASCNSHNEIARIFQLKGGCDALEKVQDSDSEDVYNLTLDIYNKFYKVDGIGFSNRVDSNNNYN